MPIETATYISDLVSSKPAASDPLSGADDHMRLIKGALKATFPNFTSAPLNSTQGQLDAAATAVANGVTLLGSTALNGNQSGLAFPDAHTTQMKAGGQVVATFKDDSTSAFVGPVSATLFTGPGVTPIGAMLMWFDDTLPTDGGTWCWANGGTLPRTGNGAALFAKWGTRYGAGDGSTTFNVPNMQEVVPVGKSGMGGASSPGLLASIAAGLKGTLNGLFGADSTTLVTANLPPYTPAGTVAVTNGAITINGQQNIIFGNTSGSGIGGGGAFGVAGQALLSASQATSSATFSGTTQGGTSAPTTNCQPSRSVNFIIRIA